MEDTGGLKPKYWERKESKSHFVHHKFQVVYPGIDLVSAVWAQRPTA
jgi:hypothetical protein